MPEQYVIVGDGVAGATAAETLRKYDTGSSIVVLTNEGEPLYNRVTIKDFAKGAREEDKCRIHDMKWYQDRDIDLRLFTPVSRVDDKNNVVICEDGTRVEYTKLLLAVGGTPRKYPTPGSTAANVHTFWTFADARKIKAAAHGAENAVSVGAGLLGIDLAVIFAKHGLRPRYIMRGDRWWRDGLNKEGSAIVEGYLADLGVQCMFHETVTEFVVDDKNVATHVLTDKGNQYPCDVAGVAIGLNMNLRLVSSSTIKTGEGILCDQYLQTSVDNVWSAGDVAQYFDPHLNRIQINGSWASAKAQGKTAALNMLQAAGVEGVERTPFEHVDFYSIDHFDNPVMSVGNIYGDEKIEAIVQDGVYRRIVFKDDRLLGAVLVGDAKPMPMMKKVIASEMPVMEYKDQLLEADFDWKALMLQAAKYEKAKKP